MTSFVAFVHPIQPLKAHLTVMSENNLHVSNQNCFAIANAIPSQPSVTRVTQRCLSQSIRIFGRLPLCLSISPLTSFLWCATEYWFIPTKTTTLRVETPLLSCTKAWCCCSWNNGGIRLQTILPHVLWNQGHTMHNKSHNILNYAMHTKMLMFEEWRQTKTNIVTLTTSTIPILETLNPFHFLVSHLCNWLLGLLLWSLHHFISWLESANNGSRS